MGKLRWGPEGPVRDRTRSEFRREGGEKKFLGQLRKLLKNASKARTRTKAGQAPRHVTARKGSKPADWLQLSACTEAIVRTHFWTVRNAKKTLRIDLIAPDRLAYVTRRYCDGAGWKCSGRGRTYLVD